MRKFAIGLALAALAQPNRLQIFRALVVAGKLDREEVSKISLGIIKVIGRGKPGVKFHNGEPFDASTVKFSFERELKINNENGPQSLLANLKSIDTPDDTTVVFNLDHADQTSGAVRTWTPGVSRTRLPGAQNRPNSAFSP